MNHDLIRKITYQAMKLLFAFLIFLFIITVFHVESNKKSPEEIAKMLEDQRKQIELLAKGRPLNENLPSVWPPEMNKEYPDFDLIDQNGRRFNLHALKGKILVVEYIDISSAVSQAQSGADTHGQFGSYDLNLDTFNMPFSDVLKKNALGSLEFPNNDKAVNLKIIVYGESGQATVDDAQNWAEHFKLSADDGYIVAVAEKDIRDDATKDMIGGYQLVDKSLRLRVNSSGLTPIHGVDMTLIPLFEKLYKK